MVAFFLWNGEEDENTSIGMVIYSYKVESSYLTPHFILNLL